MYNVKNKQSLEEVNLQINELFNKSNNFSVVRIGNMEGYFLDCFVRDRKPLDEFYHWLSLTSGVNPVDDQYLKDTWRGINEQAMLGADMLGFVDISGEIKSNPDFVNKYCNNKFTFYGVDDIMALDPGYLVNKGLVNVECKNPWTKKLKGKKVLVVSNFTKTIPAQWEKIDKVWGDKLQDIAPYDLVGVVRSPFHPKMDSRQYPGCDTWDQTLDFMVKEIMNYEYDVCLISGAAWAPALAHRVKQMGKIGITLSGVLQLHFGIIGSRWAGTNPSYTNWPKMFNEHWSWCNEDDLPREREVFNRFEKAYWK